jgi:O-antigen/teichoic acid export membrane protein
MEDTTLKECSQQSTFSGDVLKMASAPLFTQILGMILMPIVTRLYTPDVFGVFNLFGAVVMPISVFATMGYSSSIVLPHRDDVASNMLFISLALTVLVAVLTIPLVWLGSELVLGWLRAPELGIYIWFIPVNVFAIGLGLSLRYWNVRSKQFGRIAISRISEAVVNKGILIGAGFSGFATAGSLIMGAIAGSLAMSGVLGEGIWRESGQLFKRSIRWHNIVQGIKRYRKFPVYNLWNDLICRISSSITIFLFSLYFSNSVIGYYGLGLAVLSIPTTFIGSAIGEVFYQKGARARDEGTSAPLVENLFKQMTWLSMLPFLLLAIIGDSVFAFCFGAKWSEAGVYAQILSFNMFINFIINPALSLANILEKQGVSLVLSIAATITSFVSIIIGGVLNNIYVALYLLSLLNGLVLFGFGLLMMVFAGLSLSRIFGILLKCFMSCVPIIIAVALAKYYFRVSSLLLIIISAVGCIIYYGILFKEDKVVRSMIMMVISKVKSRGKS